MDIERRALLRGLHYATLAAALAPAAFAPTAAGARGDDRPLAALLLPLTGPYADLGRSLHHAALLGEAAGPKSALIVLDSGATPASAAAAAATALRRDAPLIVGPVFGPQVAAVAATVGGRVPVVTLSNDTVAGTGSFVLGVTPAQSVGAILGYARARGARRIAIVDGAGRWDMLAAGAARAGAPGLGLDIVAAADADVLLVTGGGDALTAAARTAGGVQLLATAQAMDLSATALAAIDGAWLAAPDPDGVADFARRFEAAYGNPPGQLAALAYDAIGIARTLRAGGHLDRDGMLGSAGFAGISGAVRFAADGRASRELAILVAERGRLRAVGRSQG